MSLTNPAQLPNPPQQSRSRAKVESLAIATEKLLRQKPFKEITVAELARAAGVSPAYLYTRFSNKQGLLNYLIEEFQTKQQARAGQLLNPQRWQNVTLESRLARLANHFAKAADSHGGLLRAMSEMDNECIQGDAWLVSGTGGNLCNWLLECDAEIQHPAPRQAVVFVLQIFAFCFQTRQFLGNAHPARNFSSQEMVCMASNYLKSAGPVAEFAQGDLENE